MMFNFTSLFSAILLALPLTALAAPAVPVSESEIEERSNWHYPKTHKVSVGAWGKLRYDPEYVDAKVGDYIKFEL
jgi:plastocyanin